jgi:acyl CoA:acetate/3-ketoacid CoA transferase alpha subunit
VHERTEQQESDHRHGECVGGERNIPWELCRHQLIVERVRFGGVGEAGVPAPVVVGEGVVEDSGAYLQ